jgi:hypothetical protein
MQRKCRTWAWAAQPPREPPERDGLPINSLLSLNEPAANILRDSLRWLWPVSRLLVVSLCEMRAVACSASPNRSPAGLDKNDNRNLNEDNGFRQGTTLDSADRQKLVEVALEPTADDDEKWSFVFRTRGAVCSLYCPWSVTEDWEFDGETEGLVLPWNPERLELIRRGEADPNEEELQQWRRAQSRKLAVPDCVDNANNG